MSYIDKKINTYYNLYSVRMMMVLSNGTNLESLLNRFLLLLKELEEEEREVLLQQIGKSHQLLHVGYVGRKSFERRKKANPNTGVRGFRRTNCQKEKKRLTEELLTAAPDEYQSIR